MQDISEVCNKLGMIKQIFITADNLKCLDNYIPYNSIKNGAPKRLYRAVHYQTMPYYVQLPAKIIEPTVLFRVYEMLLFEMDDKGDITAVVYKEVYE